jgi:peptidoglycan/xylan/chitin deacetylase (PgdA/CDA1 family)
LLEAFHAPAVVFVSTNHIFENKAFWWGVIERKARARAVPEKEVRRMVEQLKRLKTEEAECEVRAQFGSDALRPVNDLHRPLTPSELRDLANHPLITVGNHTQDHAILTNYSASEAFAQIQGAQEDIHTLTGKVPDIIAYPNGNETPGIVDAARKAGIHFGLGVAPGRNRLPLEPGSKEAMTMKRFMLTGDCSIEAQCRVSRSLFSLYRMGRKVKRKISGGYSAPQLA